RGLDSLWPTGRLRSIGRQSGPCPVCTGTRPALCFQAVSMESLRGYHAFWYVASTWQYLSEGGRGDANDEPHRTGERWSRTGRVGGFVGGLLRERSALTAARDAAGEGSEEQPSW